MHVPHVRVDTDADTNAKHSKYRCCFQRCHVMLGATLIGLLEAVVTLLITAGFCTLFVLRGRLFAVAFAAGIASAVISAVGIVLLLIGLKKNKHGFLLPHLVIQLIGSVVVIAIAVSVYVGLVIGSEVVIAIGNFEPPPLPVLPPPPALPAFGPFPALPALAEFPTPPSLPPPPFAQAFKEHLDKAVDKFASEAVAFVRYVIMIVYMLCMFLGQSTTLGIIVLGGSFFLLAFEIWFFVVIFKAYKFLKAKK